MCGNKTKSNWEFHFLPCLKLLCRDKIALCKEDFEKRLVVLSVWENIDSFRKTAIFHEHTKLKIAELSALKISIHGRLRKIDCNARTNVSVFLKNRNVSIILIWVTLVNAVSRIIFTFHFVTSLKHQSLFAPKLLFVFTYIIIAFVSNLPKTHHS